MGESASELPAWAEYFAPTFERVAHQLELAEGFILLPVELPDAITALLLASWLASHGHPCQFVELRIGEGHNSILEQLPPGSDAAIATLVFAEPSRLPDSALQLLNQQRDLLVAHHPRPLLWCGSDRLLDLTWRRAPDLWSVAAVPIRLPTTAVGARKALFELLVRMFSSAELRHFVHRDFTIDGVDTLPWDASLGVLLPALIDLLEQHGAITPEFFTALRSARPRRGREIQAVAKLWSLRAPEYAGDMMRAPDSGDPIIAWLRSAHVRRRALASTWWQQERPALARLEHIVAAVEATYQVHRILLMSAHETSQYEPTGTETSVEEVMRNVRADRPMLIIFLNSDRGLLLGLDRAQHEAFHRVIARIAALHFSGVIRFLLPVMQLAAMEQVARICRNFNIDFFSFYFDPP